MKTIKSSIEISNLFDSGRRLHTPEMSLIVLRNQNQHGHNGRVAFIAGKRLGNAVWRNRAKRRMRAVCAQIGGPFPGYDVVFLAKRPVAEAPFEDMVEHALKALMKAKVVTSKHV
ncbi:MAG: ribonuclease P protein component [Eggerthellaceae bacterium]|nr:ribonuclease P protein component [Eggerthellaceae bacterium]